jgi:hypothetical protein
MKPGFSIFALMGFTALLVCMPGCAKPPAEITATTPHQHQHRAPHGGTPVALGDEVYHVELVLDATEGKLQAFVLDGEMENFIRSAMPSIEFAVSVRGQPQTLVLTAVANPATGETVGDTSLFETQADWLKAKGDFEATLKTITIRGTTFTGVKFRFPQGNDKD